MRWVGSRFSEKASFHGLSYADDVILLILFQEMYRHFLGDANHVWA